MKRFEVIVITAVALADSVLAVLWMFSPNLMRNFVTSVNASNALRYLVGVCGLVVFVACVSWIFRLLRRRERNAIVVRSDEGESVIALETVEELLQEELAKAPDVRDSRVVLTAHVEGEPVDCALHFKIDNQPDIPARTDAIKRTIRETFSRMFSENVPLRISCMVDAVMRTEGDPSPEPAKRPEFTGPVYPDPDDEEEDGVDLVQ